ncbi:MAG TPA: hypothetical protein PKJ99_02455 [Thermoanaerobaculales bacterium]|nr:hypothetical protein [Thermoanaerobaculales bacterium]
MSAPRFTVGVDLGQANDYTAAVVIESEWRGEFKPELEVRVRHLDRWRGVSYVEVVDRLAELRAMPGLQDAALVVDATGVGRAVVDMIREANLRPVPVSITSGENAHQDEESGHWRVPKKDLVSVIQSLLHRRRLLVARGLRLAETLLEELSNFEIRVSAVGSVQYGTWRENAHDDLVLAVSLAAWWARRFTRAPAAYHRIAGRPRTWGDRPRYFAEDRLRGRDPYVKCPEDQAASDLLGAAAWRDYVRRYRRDHRGEE